MLDDWKLSPSEQLLGPVYKGLLGKMDGCYESLSELVLGTVSWKRLRSHETNARAKGLKTLFGPD